MLLSDDEIGNAGTGDSERSLTEGAVSVLSRRSQAYLFAHRKTRKIENCNFDLQGQELRQFLVILVKTLQSLLVFGQFGA